MVSASASAYAQPRSVNPLRALSSRASGVFFAVASAFSVLASGFAWNANHVADMVSHFSINVALRMLTFAQCVRLFSMVMGSVLLARVRTCAGGRL